VGRRSAVFPRPLLRAAFPSILVRPLTAVGRAVVVFAEVYGLKVVLLEKTIGKLGDVENDRSPLLVALGGDKTFSQLSESLSMWHIS
jgi:hypothetical protein